MAWQGWDGRVVTLEQFKGIVEETPLTGNVLRVEQVTLHNTAAPNKDKLLGEMPAKRMASWLNHYKNLLGWSGSPNLFIFPQGLIGLGCPLTGRSTHSAGFNGKSWSIEMGANFVPGDDDDDAGVGLIIKNLACQCMAILLDHRGKPVEYRKTWFLHKDDPRTTHDCPGRDIEAPDIQSRVLTYYNNLSEAGDHGDVPTVHVATEGKPVEAKVQKILVVNVDPTDTLNMRDTSGQLGKIVGKLPRGVKVGVLNEALNGATKWMRIRTPMGYEGWVSARYLAEPAATQPASIPIPQPTIPIKPDVTVPEQPVPIFVPKPEDMAVPGLAVVNDHNDVAMALLTGLPFKWKGKDYPADFAASYGLRTLSVNRSGGMTGNLMRESYARLETAALGDAKTAFGIGQWRLERQVALRAFCKQYGYAADDLIGQLLYVLHELQVDDDTDEVYAGKLLDKSTTVEEATAAGVAYERPRGWVRPKVGGKTTYDLAKIVAAAKKGDGWAVRLANAKQMVKEYETIWPH